MAFTKTHTVNRDHNGSVATFAASEVNLRNKGDRDYMSQALMFSKVGAHRAWAHYDRLGVIRYPLNRAARIAGSANLYAARLDDTGKIIGPVDRSDKTVSAAIDKVTEIYSRFGGVRGLIERYFLLMKVPADAWLIKVREGSSTDGYMFLSSSELATSTDGYQVNEELGELKWITAPAGRSSPARQRTVKRKDVIGRVWVPSPRFLEVPDSPLYTLDAECDLLWRLMVVMRAQMRSRASMSGFGFFPDTLQQMASKSKDGIVTKQNILLKMAEIWERNVDLTESGDAADTMPIFLMGDADAGEKIREIVWGQETKETDLKLRDELREYILFTLDIHTKQTKGDADTLRGAWTAGSEELRLAVIPDLESMCWALTRLVLQKELIAEGMEPAVASRLGVWYDLSEAAIRISRQEDTRQLVDRLGANLKALRRISGLAETDAPSEEEYVRQLGVLTKDPYLATFGMDIADDIDWDLTSKGVGKPQESQGDDPDLGPGTTDPGNPDTTDPDAVQPSETE